MPVQFPLASVLIRQLNFRISTPISNFTGKNGFFSVRRPILIFRLHRPLRFHPVPPIHLLPPRPHKSGLHYVENFHKRIDFEGRIDISEYLDVLCRATIWSYEIQILYHCHEFAINFIKKFHVDNELLLHCDSNLVIATSCFASHQVDCMRVQIASSERSAAKPTFMLNCPLSSRNLRRCAWWSWVSSCRLKSRASKRGYSHWLPC